MKSIKYLVLNSAILVVLLVLWFLSCFFLGYTSNANYQKEIGIAYIITIFIHFIVSYVIYKKTFVVSLVIRYMILNVLLYVIFFWYLYYNT